MKFRRLAAAAMAVMMTVSLAGCAGVTVVKIGHEAELTGSGEEKGTDVSSFWDSKAVPEIDKNKTELSELLTSANGDLKTQADKGRYTMGDSGDLNFAVHGKGKVTKFDTSKKAGYMTVVLDGYSGTTEVDLQIGPVFKQTSIRDFLSFIDVNDYPDQIAYAQLAKNINQYVYDKVLNGGLKDLTGKEIEFTGCFTYKNDDQVLITPVELKES